MRIHASWVPDTVPAEYKDAASRIDAAHAAPLECHARSPRQVHRAALLEAVKMRPGNVGARG